MKLNKLASIGVFMILIAQMCALTFAIIFLANYFSFDVIKLSDKWVGALNWLELPDRWLIAINCILISLASINIITTLISMFNVNTDMKSLSVWIAIISISVIWHPYFFPAIISFTGAILLLAGKYQPLSAVY